MVALFGFFPFLGWGYWELNIAFFAPLMGSLIGPAIKDNPLVGAFLVFGVPALLWFATLYYLTQFLKFLFRS